jgi:hypothetical protein
MTTPLATKFREYPFFIPPSRSWPDGVSKFLGWGKRQAAFAVEKFFQSPVAGTALAPDDFGRDELAAFAAITPAFEPVCPTD